MDFLLWFYQRARGLIKFLPSYTWNYAISLGRSDVPAFQPGSDSVEQEAQCVGLQGQRQKNTFSPGMDQNGFDLSPLSVSVNVDQLAYHFALSS